VPFIWAFDALQFWWFGIERDPTDPEGLRLRPKKDRRS
jgi:hypothetical protein